MIRSLPRLLCSIALVSAFALTACSSAAAPPVAAPAPARTHRDRQPSAGSCRARLGVRRSGSGRALGGPVRTARGCRDRRSRSADLPVGQRQCQPAGVELRGRLRRDLASARRHLRSAARTQRDRQGPRRHAHQTRRNGAAHAGRVAATSTATTTARLASTGANGADGTWFAVTPTGDKASGR